MERAAGGRAQDARRKRAWRRGRRGSRSTRPPSSRWADRSARPRRSAQNGIADISNEMGAFTVVRAASHEAAAKMFENHPHFAIFPGEARRDHAGAADPGWLAGVLTVRCRPSDLYAPAHVKAFHMSWRKEQRPRRARLSSRQSERGAAAGSARADRRKRRGRLHLCRCRAHGRRQPGRALPAFSRPRRIACPASRSAASSSSRRC